MDPNPRSFPVLSYVLSRFHLSSGRKNPHEADIEQPSPPQDDGEHHLELVARMPRLKRPELLAAMAQAIAYVAGTRSVLRSLGDRPDHEAVDAARARIAEIDADLAVDLETLGLGDAENREKEADRRAKAEREKVAYRAVVQLEEMHAAYEELLREAEERLVRIYDSAGSEEPAAAEMADKGFSEGVNSGGEQTDEEVVRILQEADSSGRCAERVDLSGRGLRFLPEAFGRLPGLLILNLSDNQLEAIPDSIGRLENLQELHLSSNLLTSLPDSIGLMVNLQILDVSKNKLRFLPDSISLCRSLTELDVSFNELTYLPTNIGLELLNLQRLSISLNKIRSLPTSVCEMRSLCRLDARFNELRGLPHAIGKLMNLETLDLSGNFSDLTDLPDTFGDLVKLQELDLSNNQIHALPDSFGRLENLRTLNLDGNPLVLPPAEIINQGIEAVKEFMSRRWAEILLEEDRKAAMEAASLHISQAPGGWLTRSTSWLNNAVSSVSGSLTGYLSGGDRAARDPCLDEQL